MMEAFRFIGDFDFRVKKQVDTWRGSYVVFQRNNIVLVIDFDTIALSSWLDLYDERGEKPSRR